MRAMIVAAILLAIQSAPALAQPNDPEAAYKAAGARASKPTATLAYGPAPQQVADLRLPKGKGPFPVAVILHGGCWMAGFDDRSGIAAFADALTARGMATWNVEYRQVGEPGGGWPGSFQDIAAAVDRLADLAPRYRLDLKRVTLVGHSAGAHYALWAASRSRLDGAWRGTRVHPAGVVAIDGPGDLASLIGVDAQVCGKPVIIPLMGGTPADKPEAYRTATPQDHLPFGIPQFLVTADLGDFMAPYIAAAKASGDPVTTLSPKGANHFDVVTPSSPNGQAVVDFISRNAMGPPGSGH